MAVTQTGRLRRLWLNVHLWIGVGLGVLLVPIAVSGALLVWHDDLEAWLNPARYAVTGPANRPASAYLTAAAAALAPGLQPVAVRYPAREGQPVVVAARGGAAPERGAERTKAGEEARPASPPRFMNVYLDPATARVLDVADFRSSFFGVLHRFHENLTIPEYSGRAIVGWVGVAMLTSSLTGIYLWWPRQTTFLRGLRWRRSSMTITNLHHMLGFWISVPLAAVSLTGIYLGFPQQGRQLLSSIAEMSAQQRPGSGPLARQTTLTPDAALDLALASQPGTWPAALFLPTVQRGAQGGSDAPVWRMQLRKAASDDLVIVMINDRDRSVSSQVAQIGDRIAQWIRWIHEGSHSGPIWSAIVFLCGVFPPVFVVTGMIMWLRARANRKTLERKRNDAVPQLRPAE